MTRSEHTHTQKKQNQCLELLMPQTAQRWSLHATDHKPQRCMGSRCILHNVTTDPNYWPLLIAIIIIDL